MKRFNKIIVWGMLSIMMQSAGLLYLDKVLFKESSEFTAEKVVVTTKNVEASVTIPTNAEKIEVSFDGRFITYYVDDNFILVNTKTSVITEILPDTEILFTGWIPTTNMIMVAEKITSKSEGTVVNMKTYNPKTEVENPITDVCPYLNGMEVDNIVSSVKSGTQYVSISRNGNSSTIYRININSEIEQVDNKVPALGSIKAFLSKDVLLYEDSLNKSFYRYTNGSRTKLSFDNANNLVILSANNDDMIYMGELSGNKVVNIIYGVDGTSSSSWTTETLEKPKDINDIIINNKNQILVNENLEGVVKNITTDETISYEGTFITVNDKLVCSSDNGKIYLKSVLDVDKKQEVISKK